MKSELGLKLEVVENKYILCLGWIHVLFKILNSVQKVYLHTFFILQLETVTLASNLLKTSTMSGSSLEYGLVF